MAFFLLGRERPAGELRLISTELFDSRQQALDALGLLSGQSGFEHTDAEVFVVDLDAATPVLLVATPGPTPVPEPESELEVPAEPEVTDEAETVGVWESPVEPEPEPVEPAIAEAVLAEESEEPTEQPEPAEEESAERETPTETRVPGGGLRDALAGAAVTLEESGIVAPDSVGPTPGEPADAPAWPWDSAKAGEPVAEVAPEPEPEPAPEPVYTPGPYDEPAIDGGDSLIGPGDEDAFELNRPVILGAYEESPPAVDEAEVVAEPESEPELVTGPAVDPAEVSMEAVLADVEPLEPEVADQPAAAEAKDISDLAAEPGLGEIPVAPSAEAGDESSAMTCDDCVYVNTCPNKDDRDPSTCGSFQWKSIV
jgi:hypothetical protein